MIEFHFLWVSWFLTCPTVRAALYDFIALCSLLSVSVSASLCLCLYSSLLSSIGGFIHPNPSGLLTSPNSLHSFHSHLDSFFFFFALISLPSSVLCFLSRCPSVTTLTFSLFFPVCFLWASSLSQPAQILSHEHSSACWQGCWQSELLSLKLSSCCWCSDLSWTALSGSPCLVSVLLCLTQTDADLMLWPGIIWGSYPVLSTH